MEKQIIIEKLVASIKPVTNTAEKWIGCNMEVIVNGKKLLVQGYGTTPRLAVEDAFRSLTVSLTLY